MAIATVSPYVLMQELARAQRRGGPSDYYGLGAALNSVGNDYDAMNRSVVTANQAQVSNARTGAQLDAGYYPAQVAEQMAGMRNRTYDLDQHMAMSKAIEDAHQAVTAQGLRAGTPEYAQAMNVYLSQHGGYNAATSSIKAAKEASIQMQNKAFAQLFVKHAVENELTKRIAQDYFNKESGDGLMSMTEGDKDALWKQAVQVAKKKMLDSQVNVKLDHDGNVTAADKDGNNIPIPPQIVAAASSALGNPTGMNLLEHLGTDYQKYFAQQQKQTTTSTPKAATTKGGVDLSDIRALQHEELKSLRVEQTKMSDKELSPRGEKHFEEVSARIKELQDQLYGTGKGETPYTSTALPLGTGNAGPYGTGKAFGSVSDTDFVNPPGFMYGMEPNDATASTPNLPTAAPNTPAATSIPFSARQGMPVTWTPPWLDWARQNTIPDEAMYGVPVMPSEPGR